MHVESFMAERGGIYLDHRGKADFDKQQEYKEQYDPRTSKHLSRGECGSVVVAH